MRQVLFDIRLDWLHAGWHVPIYGYGLMLFLAFIFADARAAPVPRRRDRRADLMPGPGDLAVRRRHPGGPTGLRRCNIGTNSADKPGRIFPALGRRPGPLRRHQRRHPRLFRFLSSRPAQAQRLHTGNARRHRPLHRARHRPGRIGCLCTGCCYGNVACEDAPRFTSPSPAPPPWT